MQIVACINPPLETVHLLSDKQNHLIPHRLDDIGLSGRTPKLLMPARKGVCIHYNSGAFAGGPGSLQPPQIVIKALRAIFHKHQPVFYPGDLAEAQIFKKFCTLRLK